MKPLIFLLVLLPALCAGEIKLGQQDIIFDLNGPEQVTLNATVLRSLLDRLSQCEKNVADLQFSQLVRPSCLAHKNAGGVDSGFFLISSNRVAGGTISVYCDQVTEGGGWVDVVKTLSAYGNTDFGDAYLSDFFVSNDATDGTSAVNPLRLTVGIGRTMGEEGIFIENQFSYGHYEGFYLWPSFSYSSVRAEYRMQGADESGTRCSSSSWIPLQGPGYEGGLTVYNEQAASLIPNGYTSLAGSSKNGRDASIQASFSSDTIDSSNTLLTWLNSRSV